MGANSVKITLVLVFSALFCVFSCQTDVPAVSDDKSDDSDIFQLYDRDGTPFKSSEFLNDSFELVGFPSLKLASGYYPWKLYGRVVNGIMEIDFPDVELVLREGVQMDSISIEHKTRSNFVFDIRKLNNDFVSSVKIYYLTNDLIHKEIYVNAKMEFIEQELKLKEGWNFIERIRNTEWVYGNDKPYYVYRFISHDINDVLKEGYRWHINYFL